MSTVCVSYGNKMNTHCHTNVALKVFQTPALHHTAEQSTHLTNFSYTLMRLPHGPPGVSHSKQTKKKTLVFFLFVFSCLLLLLSSVLLNKHQTRRLTELQSNVSSQIWVTRHVRHVQTSPCFDTHGEEQHIPTKTRTHDKRLSLPAVVSRRLPLGCAVSLPPVEENNSAGRRRIKTHCSLLSGLDVAPVAKSG